MNKESSILQFFKSICRFNFGNFETQEFKKFLRLGAIFALIIGIYWTLRPLKDAVFIHLVGGLQIPFAKTISVIALLPLVIFYTKLLEKNSKEKMLVILPLAYSISIFIISILLWQCWGSSSEIAGRSSIFLSCTKVFGYFFYLFVESFGSLVIALFWAFATDTTVPASAKRGFPLVVTLGQMGGIVLPYTIGGLPHRLGLTSDTLSLLILGVLTFLIIPLFRYFLKSTPKALLTTFEGSNQTVKESIHETGFLEGLKLLLKNRYLLGIFAVNFVFEVVVTIFDFNFKLAASSVYSGVVLSNYLSIYASSVNIVALLCLVLGISNITRYLGVGVALALTPIIVGLALFGFLNINSLSFLFALMVGSKAINYALNGPALKQLYIPTTKDVKFKAQAWVETFGSRTSKQVGSVFNMSLSPLQTAFGTLAGKSHYLALSGAICFPLLGVWLIITLFLGKSFRKAINTNTVIC
jgi:AAA family ATP:ADP antiporter